MRLAARALAFAVGLAAALPLAAQEQSRAILVMDGSGSMWGQIDGKAKITIAQEVVAELLPTFPETQALGLTIYGHRRKGDCSDIETVVQPGLDTRSQIADAVNGISPKGKTPMTDAVQLAAEALRYTEEAATVILVSDGIETCAPDPCAAARALEESGVDFTAHVVGFDVTEAEALRQMQCIADETGGSFIQASNASELSAAMFEVVEAVAEPEPEPQPVEIAFRAIDGQNGPQIGEGLVWTLIRDGVPVFDARTEATFKIELLPGEYVIEVLRTIDEENGELRFGVGERSKTMTVVLPEYRPLATIDAPDSAPAGSTVQVRWTGPNAKNDFISSATADLHDSSWITYQLTREGPLLDLKMPSEPGEFELRYVLSDGRKVLARKAITVTPVTATVAATSPLIAGGTSTIEWTGPDYKNDYISIGEPGEKADVKYAYTRDGSPLSLAMPPEPGEYELRYVMAQDRRHIVTVPVVVEATSATVSPPAQVEQGSTIAVDWTGPDNKNDYIAVFKEGEQTNQLTYSYTRDGSPAQVRFPAELGTYEVSYVLATGRRVIASTQVTVIPSAAAVMPPAEIGVGARVAVEWTGPNNKNDYIALFPVGSDDYVSYSYTNNGSPGTLQVPGDPGDYEVRYVLNMGRTPIASAPMKVVAATATVSPPAEAAAGSRIAVEWTGPANKNDYIAIFPVGSDDYVSYAYTNNGSPGTLQMPAEPGDYEVRYVLNAGRNPIASAPMKVTAVNATVSPPAEAGAGAKVAVEWTGPANRNDYIAIFPVGGTDYISYAYTNNGSPGVLTMPSVEGDYEVRYIMNIGRGTLATAPIKVLAASASITAPQGIVAGSTVAVTWEGPDNARDYLAVMPRGSQDYVHYAYTKDGSPARLKMPSEAGEYDITYVMDKDRRVIARVPITITAATASLTLPEKTEVGSDIVITWEGPDNQRDFIAVYPRGDLDYLTYTYTRDGSPLRLRLPSMPGEYDIGYTLDIDRKVIARVPITVTEASATLSVPELLPPGAKVEVKWDGPGNKRDYVAVMKKGTNEYINYVYAEKGRPMILQLPDQAGDYDLTYVLDQDDRVITRVPIKVK